MTKALIHLSIDPKLRELARDKIPNLSGEFEEYLKMRLVSNVSVVDNKIETLTKMATDAENRLISLKKQLEDAQKEHDVSVKQNPDKYKEELGW